MKTHFKTIAQALVLSALGMFVLAGCTKSGPEPQREVIEKQNFQPFPSANSISVSAYFGRDKDGTDGTRTSLQGPDYVNALWVKGDQIGIYSPDARTQDVGSDDTYKVLNQPFSADNAGTSTTFSGVMYWKNTTQTHDFYAYYPWQEQTGTFAAAPISLKPLQTQLSAGNTDHVAGLDFMVAKPVTIPNPGQWGANVPFSFYHVFTMLEFRVTGTGSLSKITISSTDAADVLAFTNGTIDLSQTMPATADANYIIKGVASTLTGCVKYKSVTLNITNAATLSSTPQSFYMMINPSDLSAKNLNIILTINGDDMRMPVKQGKKFLRDVKYQVDVDASLAEPMIDAIPVTITCTTVAGTLPATAGITGTLKTAIDATGIDPANITNLKVLGDVNKGDFLDPNTKQPNLATLLPNLAQIDLSEVTTMRNGITSATNSLPGNAFNGCTSLLKVILPPTLTTVGEAAFQGCTSLYSLTPPTGGLTQVQSNAFMGCVSLTCDINQLLSPNLIGLASDAFLNCYSLTGHLTLGSSVTTLGSEAFRGCSGLTGQLRIDGSAAGVQIPASAFMDCTGLTSLVLSNNITMIDNYAFQGCSNLGGSLTLPENPALIQIGDQAFLGCNKLTGPLVIPKYIKMIGTKAFANLTQLSSLSFASDSQIRNICDNAFFGCSGLKGGLTIPDGIYIISHDAFHGCSGFNGALTIGASGPKFGLPGYENNPAIVTTAYVNDPVIGGYAFMNCGFTGTLSIGEGFSEIGGFNGCSLLTGTLKVPASVKTIGMEAFNGCSGLTAIDFNQPNPSNLKVIAAQAFQDCVNLGTAAGSQNLVIPSGVNNIGMSAFLNCKGYTGYLEIPASVQYIFDFAFYGCSNVSSIRVSWDPAGIGTPIPTPEYKKDDAGRTMLPTGMSLYVPSSYVAAYKTLPGWGSYNVLPQ